MNPEEKKSNTYNIDTTVDQNSTPISTLKTVNNITDNNEPTEDYHHGDDIQW